jgi:hypothetical protein
MEYLEHCAAVEREVDAIVEAVASGPVDTATPTCPGWTVTDLVGHVGGFSGFWAHVLCEERAGPTRHFPTCLREKQSPAGTPTWPPI